MEDRMMVDETHRRVLTSCVDGLDGIWGLDQTGAKLLFRELFACVLLEHPSV